MSELIEGKSSRRLAVSNSEEDVALEGAQRIRRNKRDEQWEQTHRNLIETAESLFAEQGIAAVSLRQIAEQAGSLNTSAVRYYFGNKEALLEAIYRHRLPQIEKWRAAFLADLDRDGRGSDLGALLQAIWVPWYEQRDKDGRHSYGRFLLNSEREGLSWMRVALDPDYPASFELHNRVRGFLETSGVGHPEFRFAMQINMILETLCFIDRHNLSGERSKDVFYDALEMALAALTCGG